MPNLKPGTIIPTEEEDAKIRAGIAADPRHARTNRRRFRADAGRVSK